ncbi:MAG TPA: glycosyltransferase family 2 protein [Burkholderiales bacterium]|nr:glycosyltransferase family 2 protein [Burkholderiales bacterium]
MSEAAPLISIITSTLNAVEQLPHTARSIAAQRGARFEWIVIDGGSTDGTQALLRQHEHLIARWLSEPDAGIYDAWNKACALARGEWLLFLGAGDEFPAPGTLAELSRHLAPAHPDHDLVYGRLIYISQAGRRDLEEVGVPWKELEGRWEIGRPALPPHAATFHHRSLFAGGRAFDARYRLAGDAHFLLRYALRKPLLHIPLAVCRTPVGGLTMNLRNVLELAREIRVINRELALAPPLRHRVVETLLLGAKVAAGLMPAPVGHWIADIYRRLIRRPKRWSVR